MTQQAVSDRRMRENQVVFRKANEGVQKKLKNLRKIADEEKLSLSIKEDELHLQFYCECSDENCRERIGIKGGTYNRIHKKRARFMLLNGHEVLRIEQVVDATPAYCVVEKFITPTENVKDLQTTVLHNV
jgi:hypothetical protein